MSYDMDGISCDRCGEILECETDDEDVMNRKAERLGWILFIDMKTSTLNHYCPECAKEN